MRTIVLQGANLTLSAAKQIAERINGHVQPHNSYINIDVERCVDAEVVQLRQVYDFDINIVPEGFNHETAGLLVTDMDSTLINIECVDEIADFMNLKPKVAEITEAAMRGEIDFETSLRSRVSLLKGLEISALEHVYNERLQLNPGAELMVKTLQQKGIKVALVSGGFTFFTNKLKQRLGLDYTSANQLGEHNGRLTGEVIGDIVCGQAKAEFLVSCCAQLGIAPNQAIAVGDGANDLLMMAESGLSVAYHAKPKVQQQASTALNHCGLDGVLGLLQHDVN